MAQQFEMYKDEAGEYRWRFRAANGKIIADSAEGYKDRRSCRHGMDLLRQGAADAPVEDRSEEA